MSGPAISVVMPVFNGERYLDEAIASVLAQSWRDLELILVDDGSTDASQSIAARHAAVDPRVRALGHPGGANRGVAASRNAGVVAARAPLIAFIDADDRWTAAKLAEQQAIMARHPDIGLLAGATRYWRSWDGAGDEVRPVGAVRDRVIPAPEALLTTYPLARAEAPAPSSFMMTAAALARVGGFEESFVGRFGFYEDQAFLAKVYLDESVYFANACWLDYRQHGASALASGLQRGDYLAARAHFLRWFDRYLAGRSAGDRRVRRRMRAAQLGLQVARLRRAIASLAARALRR